MSQYYSEELSQKVRRGMKETRLKGNFTGGFIIYGYKVDNHKVVIDEEHAETVRYIYEQYSMGVYVKDIIASLTARGILNHGKPFARNTVYNILANEKYSGIYRFNGEVFDNIYPQIVPQDIYDKVRAKIHKNKYGKRSTEVVYLLRHKMVCGYCGSPISAECGTAKNGQKKRYYKCLGRKHGNGCKKSQARKEVLEKYVLDNIIEQLSKPENIKFITSMLLKIQESNCELNSALNRLTREKRRTENSIQNIMSAIESGGTSNTAMKRLRELETLAEELERQICIEKANTALRLTEKDILNYFEHGLRQEPLLLINLFVKEIRLFDDKMIIIYNTPISLDESQGFCFYEDNVPYPIYIQNKIKPRMIDFQLEMRF